MKLRDRLHADREMLKTLDNKSKGLFLWDYYKLPILGAVCLLVVLIAALTTWTSRKDVALYAVFVNTDYLDVQPDAAALDELLAQSGMDMEGKSIDITADLSLGRAYNEEYDGQTIQILASLFGISGLDVFAADQAVFDRYAVQDAFLDLSLFLEPELWDCPNMEPYWYENSDGHTILGGIVLKSGSPLHRAGYYHTEVVVGIAANAENLDEAIVFLRQLLTDTDD